MSNFFKLHEAIMATLNEEGPTHTPQSMAALQRHGEQFKQDQQTPPSDQSQSRYGNVKITGQADVKLNMLLRTLADEQAPAWSYRRKGAILEKIIQALGFRDEMEAVRVIQQMRAEVQSGALGTQASQ